MESDLLPEVTMLNSCLYELLEKKNIYIYKVGVHMQIYIYNPLYINIDIDTSFVHMYIHT